MSVNEICSLAEAVLPGGFCAFTLPVSLSGPRGVIASVGDGPSDFLALERGSESVVYVFDDDNDGIPESKRTLATETDLNHGLAIYDGYIYASSDRNVWRWPYDSFDSFLGDSELVVTNINPDGMGGAPQGHETRTLVFDDIGRLYISIGSVGNVDPDSHRSRIRRFNIIDGGFPLDFQNGEVFADGLRNEVGMAFDRHGVLWGVENGADRLYRQELGGDIHNDNPAEELNRFREEDAGKHWGYPYCWTEYDVPGSVALGGEGRGTVWAWPSFLDDITDQECRDNYERSVIAMQAHSAPLGIEFYKWKPREELPEICDGVDPFPRRMDGYAFIGFHGSWNRDIPTGYKVVYVPFDSNGDPIGDSPIDLLAHEPPNAKWDDDFRPVDVSFDECGRLLVSGDGSGSKMVRIQYNATNDPITPDPTDMPTNPPTSIPTAMPTNPPTPLPTGTPTTTTTTPQDDIDSETTSSPQDGTKNNPSPNPSSAKSNDNTVEPSSADDTDDDDPCPCMPTNSPVTIPNSSGSTTTRSDYIISILLFFAFLWS